MIAALLLASLAAGAPPPATSFDKLAAKAAAAREANRLDEAAGLYRTALRLNPKWEDGWWFLGSLHYEKDRYRECRDSFLRLTTLNRKGGPAFAMLGLCEFYLGLYGESFRHLTRSEELGLPDPSPLIRVVYYHQALLLMKLENYERAMFLLSLLIKDDQEDPAAVAALGVAALRRPQFPKEVPEADRPLVLQLGQAVALGFQRRPVEARTALEAIVRDHPTLPNLRYTYGTFLLGQDADGALREWKAELETQPQHLPSLVSLAFEYLTRGDIESARPYAERAIKVAPEHFTSRAAIGRVMLEGGDHQGAIPHLEAAAKAAPDSPQIRLALATAYGRAGRKAEADRERAAFAALKKGKS